MNASYSVAADLAVRLRVNARSIYSQFERMRTHSESCWQWHKECMMLVAADAMEFLLEEIADLERTVRALEAERDE